jgi:hypothetical protein
VYNANAAGGAFRSRTAASITEYLPGSTTPEYTISSSTYLTFPAALGVDGSGNVYLANGGGAGDVGNGNVVVFAPGGSATPIATLSDPNLVEPGAMAVDSAGDVYVYDALNNDVAYFAGPPTGTPPTTQTSMTQLLNGGPFLNVGSMQFDPSGDLLVDGNGEFQMISATGLPNSQTVTLSLSGNGYGAWIP